MKLNPHQLHNTSKHIGVNRRQDFDVGQNVFDGVALVLLERNLFPKYQLAVQRMIFLKWQRRKQLSLEWFRSVSAKKNLKKKPKASRLKRISDRTRLLNLFLSSRSYRHFITISDSSQSYQAPPKCICKCFKVSWIFIVFNLYWFF